VSTTATTTEKEEPSIPTLDDFAVEIEEEVFAKIMHWIDKASGEVSGLGKIENVNGVMRVTSAILLKQENTSVTTDIDAAAIGKAMFELKDQPGALNWWWHSHVNMDVFWSGTDLDTIHKIGQGGWFLATVLNKRREMKSAYFQKGNGFLPPMFVDDIPTSTVLMIDEAKSKTWDKEFDDKVVEKKFTSTTTLTSGRSNYYSQDFGWGGKQSYEGAHVYNDHGDRDDMPSYRFLSEVEEEDQDRHISDTLHAELSDEELNDLICREIKRQEAEAKIREEKRNNKGKKKGIPQT
jgi:hypothetical protein